MRPVLVQWLEAHGFAAVLAPDYLVLAGVGAVLGGMALLRVSEPRWRPTYALALFVAYVATYLGGHLFEAVRAVPQALRQGDISLVLNAGRAAWGGLLGAMVGAAFVLRRERAPLRPFFDAAAVGVGVVFACVRVGCFLGGCDYGTPTGSAVGVRFPQGSFAAIAHAQAGWISAGQPSLPVHPTELYEAAFGAVSALVMVALCRRRRCTGHLFELWLVLYSVFRFCNELWRGDVDRGVYFGLSTAQCVSVVIVVGVALTFRRGQRPVAALSSERSTLAAR